MAKKKSPLLTDTHGRLVSKTLAAVVSALSDVEVTTNDVTKKKHRWAAVYCHELGYSLVREGGTTPALELWHTDAREVAGRLETVSTPLGEWDQLEPAAKAFLRALAGPPPTVKPKSDSPPKLGIAAQPSKEDQDLDRLLKELEEL